MDCVHWLALQVARRAFNAAASSSVKRVSQALVERFQSDREVENAIPARKHHLLISGRVIA